MKSCVEKKSLKSSKDVQTSPHRHRNSNYLSLPKKSCDQVKIVKSPCPSVRSHKQHQIDDQVSVNYCLTDSIDNLTNEVRKIEQFDFRVDGMNLQSSRSKSCLVYVPTDPWIPINLDMDQTNNNNSNSNTKSMKSKKKGENRMKKLMTTKSLSRPDLDADDDEENDDDPWVYDETIKTEKRSVKRTSRSFHSETSSGRSGTLQYKKSPNESNKSFPSSTLSYAHREPMLSLSPTLGYRTVDETQRNKTTQHLNVSNPNLLQPRHSFSSSTTTSKRDDELTLNIRRLSEEINRSSNYTNDRNFSSTANINQNLKIGDMTTTTTASKEKGADSLLETTC